MLLIRKKNVNSPACFRERKQKASLSRGAAIIELAVCLPVLVVVTLATVEACAMIHLKQTLTIAAFEGARLGVIPGSQAVNVEAQCQLILADHGVVNYAISMLPADPSTLTPGNFFRVTAAAECSPNSLLGGWFYAGKTFSESVELAFY